jgi:hypothetical protein
MVVSSRRDAFAAPSPGARSYGDPVAAPVSISRVLHLARLQASLSPDELARRAGVESSVATAIDLGEPVEVASPTEFLLDLGRLADTLGIPGPVVEETLTQWARAFAADGPALPGWAPRTKKLFPTPPPAVPSAASEAPAAEEVPLSPRPIGPQRVRWSARGRLRLTILLTGLLLAGSSVTLGLAKAGVLGNRTMAPAQRAAALVTPPVPAPLLSRVGTGPLGASYVSPSGVLTLSFVASQASWVEVRSGDGTPSVATTIGRGTTAPIAIEPPFTVEIGAGGTSLVVTRGTRSQTLTPPRAPFTFSIASG